MTLKNHFYGARKLRAMATLTLALSLSTFPAAFTRAVNSQTPNQTSAPRAKTGAAPANESPGEATSHWLPVGHATQALALAGARTVTRTRSSARSSIRAVVGARGLIVVVSTTSGPVGASGGRLSWTRTG